MTFIAVLYIFVWKYLYEIHHNVVWLYSNEIFWKNIKEPEKEKYRNKNQSSKQSAMQCTLINKKGTFRILGVLKWE